MNTFRSRCRFIFRLRFTEPWLKPELRPQFWRGNEEKNQRVVRERHALGVPTFAMGVDVTARGQPQPALEKVEETLGPVNILINNAGIINFFFILLHPPSHNIIFYKPLN